MKRLGAVMGAGLAAWLAAANGAVPLSYTWPDGTFNVSTGDLTLTQPSPGPWESAFAEAAARWSARTIVTVTTDGDTQAADCRTSGPNSTFFMDSFCGTAWGSTTLATTRTRFFPTGAGTGDATHTDIVFNAGIDWVVDDGAVHGGRVDFTRVAVHELGHSIGLDHTPDPTAIMYFLSGRRIEPQTDDVFGTNRIYGADVEQLVSLEDLNGNGWDELGVVQLRDGNHVLQVRDGKGGGWIRSLNLGPRPLLSLVAVADASGNGTQEVAALSRLPSGAYRLRVIDLESKSVVSQRQLGARVRWVDVVTVPDTDGGGQPDLVVLGLDGAGQVKAQVVDAATGSKLRGLPLGSAEDVVQLLALPDLDGDRLPEVAALVRNTSGAGVARIRSVVDGRSLGNLAFGAVFAPLALALGDDVDADGGPELLQLGRNDRGEIRVMRRDLGPGAETRKTLLGALNRPLGLVALDDANGDGVPDYGAILQKENEAPRLRLLDGLTGAPFKSLFFEGIGDVQDVVVLTDQNGSGRREVAVLGNLRGSYRTETRDGRTGKLLNATEFP